MFQGQERLACAPDVLSRVLDGEAVLLDLKSGTYFGLNEVGTRAWELVGPGATFAAVRDALLAEFEVEVEVLGADLSELFTTLEQKGLARIER